MSAFRVASRPEAGPDLSYSSVSVSDSQQLFVGNLRHNFTEQDLRKLFRTFGKLHSYRYKDQTKSSIPN